jgi:RNA polymerase sigma-70 factor, ECF subfamily
LVSSELATRRDFLDKSRPVVHHKLQMTGQNDFSQRVRACCDRLTAVGVDALGALFDLTSHRLVRFAAALTRHQHDAEDAVQTVLVRLASEPLLLARVACPWAYLLRMVRNEVLLLARRQQRCRATGDLADLVTQCRVDELEREESHRAVWMALRTLPPEQAEVVVLKIWEAMTFAQIGEILEASPNTVASRYQYAMTKLTTRLLAQQREVQHG